MSSLMYFDQVLYLSDTGRHRLNSRKTMGEHLERLGSTGQATGTAGRRASTINSPPQEEWIRKGLVFHSTADIIRVAEEGRLPD